MDRIWIAVSLLISLTYLTNGKNSSTKKVVCVIGAGQAGLFSLKQIADKHDLLEPIVFEKNSDIGGQWIYTNNGDIDEHGLPVQSGIYKSLRTTGPKELMACPEFEFKGENRSCVRHETVLEYLRNYTDHFNLRRFIKVNTLVEKVVSLSNSSDWRKTKWLVNTRNLNTNTSTEITCDFIVACNGHKYKPLAPDIPGMETFPGRILHSHSYRIPEDFYNQTIVLLGASVSGRELAFELSGYARTVYLSNRHEKLNITDMPKNIMQVPGVIAAKGRDMILQDDSTIDVDVFIFCTGYKIDFPFLEPSSGIKIYEKYLYPLYKQVVNIKHPSMSFIGFPSNLMSFCLKPQLQAEYYVALITGKAELPTRAEMMKDATFMIPGNPEIEKLEWQWKYLTGLATVSGAEPLDEFYKRGHELWNDHTLHNLHHYKEYDLRKYDNGSIAIVKSGN